jgi:hypothetical protein
MPQTPRFNRKGELVKSELEGFHGSPQKNITEFDKPTWISSSKDLSESYSISFTPEGDEIIGKVYPVKVDQGKVLKIFQFKDWVDLVNRRAPNNNKLKRLILESQTNDAFGNPPQQDIMFGENKQKKADFDIEISKWMKENRNWEKFEKKTLENRKKFGKDYSPWGDGGYELASSFSENYDPLKSSFSNQSDLVNELFNLGYDTLAQMEAGVTTYIVKDPKRIKINEAEK